MQIEHSPEDLELIVMALGDAAVAQRKLAADKRSTDGAAARAALGLMMQFTALLNRMTLEQMGAARNRLGDALGIEQCIACGGTGCHSVTCPERDK